MVREGLDGEGMTWMVRERLGEGEAPEKGGKGTWSEEVCTAGPHSGIFRLHHMRQLTPYLFLSSAVLYRKVVSYLLLRSGLGSATDIAVVREASGEMVLYLKATINTTRT